MKSRPHMVRLTDELLEKLKSDASDRVLTLSGMVRNILVWYYNGFPCPNNNNNQSTTIFVNVHKDIYEKLKAVSDKKRVTMGYLVEFLIQNNIDEDMPQDI